MSNRNFGYYGNNGINRLQQQNYARNLYINNTNGKQIISNPQTSNGNASIFNTYHEGSQTAYSQGLGSKTVSLGGIFGIPAVPAVPAVPEVPVVPVVPCPTIIDINSIATFNNDITYTLNENTTISECSILNIPSFPNIEELVVPNFVIPNGLTLINNGIINNERSIFKNDGTIINNGTINGTNAGCIENHNIFINNGTMHINQFTYLYNNSGTFTNNSKIYVYTTPYNGNINLISTLENSSEFINNGEIYSGPVNPINPLCGPGFIDQRNTPIIGPGIITSGCP